jgi:hypothetical protein
VKAATREAELEDMLGTIGQTFLGVTLNCARCHNHKFDPIPQSDYYRVKAVFQGVRHGERDLLTPEERKLRDTEAAQNKSKLPQTDRPQPSIPMGYVAKPEKPEATFVLHRGEPDRKPSKSRPARCLP